VTFLPAHVQGRSFYLYLILDLYSRKIVTPAQRHAGQNRALLSARQEPYLQARRSNPLQTHPTKSLTGQFF
jgi:hypothetical protein